MELTVVVSIFNEEGAIPTFFERARQTLDRLGRDVEFLFVDDGSVDGSADLVSRCASSDPRFRLLRLSRNFGHEAAMIAGIDHARGGAVVCMDGDLQHPIEEIPRMLAAYDAGHDVIMMVRRPSHTLPLTKRLLSSLFYRFINLISPTGIEPSASDFFLVSPRVVRILRSEYRERVRFLRGYIQMLGFRKTRLEYDPAQREHGESRYTFGSLLQLSLNAILGFSNLPLRLGVLMGGLVAAVGTGIGGYSLVMRWLGDPPPGYTTLVVLVCFLFSAQFVITGVVGEYVGHVFAEVKARPIYIVADEVRAAGGADAS